MEKKKVLIIYYSFSSQSRNLLNSIAQALGEEGVEVTVEPIRPLKKRRFPIGSYMGTLKLILSTFIRKRDAVDKLSPSCRGDWDLIILGGPTWSFNPSGPVLALLDREKTRFFKDKKVLPVISCRSLWRGHYYSLKRMLSPYVQEIYKPIVFFHPAKEPWCTIGLFLKVSGKMPESWKSHFSVLYPKFGHTKEQYDVAREFGTRLAKNLQIEDGIRTLKYDIPLSKLHPE